VTCDLLKEKSLKRTMFALKAKKKRKEKTGVGLLR
jgi:hypothetical protein